MRILSLAQYPLVIVGHLLEETILLGSFDHLVLLHLRHAPLLVAVSLAKHAAYPEGITAPATILRPTTPMGVVVGIEVARSILILTVSLHRLQVQVEVTPVKVVVEILHIVQEIALGTTRLIVDFDLVDETATFDLEVGIETTARHVTYVLDSVDLLFEFFVFL